ncbi:MAG: CapA family protein [Enhygromyxa sp.]
MALLTALASPRPARAYGFDDAEQAHQYAYLATAIALQGRIVDERGLPLDGAQLRLIGWGENIFNDGEAAMSWFGGGFSFPVLARRNALLEISLEGYYTELIPVELQRGLDEDTLELPDIELVARQPGRARLSFAGDAMFGRRMFERGVLDPETLAADTEALFRFVEPLLQADDHTAINLETPVTDQLGTPHPSKAYVFNAYPPSAEALPAVGVDSVSLGNNHVYDYLALGLYDTLAQLDAIGLPHYGAGVSASEAAASVYRPTINGVELSLQGFSDLSGKVHGLDALELIALDAPIKPGALHASPEQLDAFVEGEVAQGRLAIPIIHGGLEYAPAQSPEIRAHIERVVERGAALVIAHHPHVVHGVQLLDAGAGPRLVFGSLGNFVFDQDIFETLRSYVVVVDLSDLGGGPTVERVRLIPIVLDDYAPRLLVGDAIAKLGRHLAHLSVAEAAESGSTPALVFAEGGRLVVATDESEVSVTDLIDTRSIPLHEGRTGVVAIERFTPTDAIARIVSDTAAACQLGRDRLGIGDFEEPDVDDRYREGDLWSQSSHRYLQSVETRSGTGAAVLLRHSSHATAARLRMTRRLVVSPGRQMTLHGWHAAQNAGLFVVNVRWRDAEGSAISYTSEYASFGGSFEWSSFAAELTVPPDASSLEVDFNLHPPDAGEGRLLLDDLVFIEWDPEQLAIDTKGVALATPNGWDFLRCEAPGSTLPLTLVHRVYARKLSG